MSHACALLLCESDHYCDCNKCPACHEVHVQADMLIEMWGDCPSCADVIAWDIQRGVRCQHGALIPDGYCTDLTCKECEGSYEFGDALQILNSRGLLSTNNLLTSPTILKEAQARA